MNQVAAQSNQQMAQPTGASQMASSGAMLDSNKAIAEIQTAMTIAKHFPRNEILAIEKIQNAFQRKGLAEVSQYQYARGGTKITGPSIRSAEAIAQLWGNMEFGFRELHRGKDENGVGYSEIQAYAWDMESNTKRPTTFIVKHWRDKKNGQGYALTDERDIYELTANMAQRRVRACIINVIPGDVFDTAITQATKTMLASADMSAENIKNMVTSFSSLFNVTKEQIEERIQRKLTAIEPAQVVDLKRIHTSLSDGMSNPSDWFGGATDEQSSAGTATAATQTVAAATKAAETGEAVEMPDDEFINYVSTIQQKIESGQKSNAQMVEFLTSKGYLLSGEQLNTINGFKAK